MRPSAGGLLALPPAQTQRGRSREPNPSHPPGQAGSSSPHRVRGPDLGTRGGRPDPQTLEPMEGQQPGRGHRAAAAGTLPAGPRHWSSEETRGRRAGLRPSGPCPWWWANRRGPGVPRALLWHQLEAGETGDCSSWTREPSAPNLRKARKRSSTFGRSRLCMAVSTCTRTTPRTVPSSLASISGQRPGRLCAPAPRFISEGRPV